MPTLSLRRLALALSPLLGALWGCGDGGSDGLTLRFQPTGPTCSLDGATCDAAAGIPFRVTGAMPPEAPLDLALSFDADGDGGVDEVLVVGDVLAGTAPDFVVSDRFPIGEHVLLVEVVDGDGNEASASIPFTVADCKAPAPICINGLAVELMPVEPGTDVDGDGDIDAGAMTIFATDFVASLVSDCSEPVRYSIHREGQTPDIDRSSLVLTCDDPATLMVEIVAWDAAENDDFCETFVLVQDSMFDLCGP